MMLVDSWFSMTMTMTCGGVTVKFVDEFAVPPGVVTWIAPVVAPVGTVVLILMSEVTVKVGWVVRLNFTTVAPVKLVPLITTGVATAPLVGLKLLIVGSGDEVTVKFVDEFAVPPGVVTWIAPVVAPVGTAVLILMSEFTVKVGWVVRLNFTTVAPVKLVPLITTGVATAPLSGLKLLMVGSGDEVTVKFVDEFAVPPGVVTWIAPVVAPVGTVVLILMSEFTVKVGWVVRLNFTTVAPVKLVPLITTGVATAPLVGRKLLMVGSGDEVTVKFVDEFAVPPGVVTWIAPVVAPVGTVVLILMSEFTVKVGWVVRLNCTTVAPVKLVPLITTGVATAPLGGRT